NLEQLLPAGAVSLASLDADVLATSRERINVGAEQEYPLPPLPVDDAVALFAQRARQLKPSFEPDQHVTEIARRLDGLPLALELAAARVKVLTAEQILERLGHGLDLLTGGTRDAPQRHRTLRATIAWSYELLTKDERALFRRFAVFAGSFDLDAAERVCDADLDLIGSLVDKSLLRQTDEGRFFMLETIREYAAEQLGGCEEAHERRRRHADYFLSVAEYQATESKDSRSVAFTRLDRDHENFRAALSCFSSTEELERELRLVLALNDFWDVRGHLREGRKHVEAALRHAGEHHPALRVKVLAMASDYARVQGDLSGARAFCEEGLTLAQQIGDLEGVARALHELGEAAVSEEDFERAIGLFEQAVIVAGQVGLSGAGSIGNLGDIALARGDYRRAKALS